MNHVPSFIVEMSKNPLVILLTGALVGSILVPRVNARMERTRRLHELRLQRATVVLKSGFDVERKFNAVTTTFQAFYKDEIVTGTANDDSRKAFRTRIHETYQEFDLEAWWWHWQTLDEVRVLQLVGIVQLRQLEHAVKNYQEALLASTHTLNQFWEESLRHAELVSPEKGAQTMKEISPQLEQCRKRRRESVLQMVEAIIN